MRYATAAALRAALDQRLVTEANASRTDIARLRRRVTFERLLVRFALADGERWVLKGGAAVEVRLDTFRAMGIHGAMGPVWRASVDCRLDGRTFDHVVIDVVVRISEVQRTE